MQFAAFTILTAVIIIRPAELFTAMLGWPIYNYTILLNLAISFLLIFPQFSWTSIKSRPITALVFGLFVAIVLSQAWQRDFYSLRVCADEFFRVILFYLLLTGTVTTTGRLRSYLFWVTIFLAFITILILLQFHGQIDMPTLQALEEGGTDEETGEVDTYLRLQGTGLFQNPNAYSRILTVGVLLSCYGLTDPIGRYFAPVWLGAIALFGHAMILTKSRGGFLGLLAGLTMLFIAKLGMKKALPIIAIAAPIMFVVFGGGRQTDLSSDEGTAQTRIQHWYDGFEAFKRTPIFGVGMSNYQEHAHGYVAHNSFVHAYVELGIVGGVMYTGIYYILITTLWNLRKSDPLIVDPLLVRIRPFLLAIFVGEAVGMLAISRNYVLPTYLLIGVGTVYLDFVGKSPGVEVPRLTSKLVKKVVVVGLAVLIVFMLYVRYKAK